MLSVSPYATTMSPPVKPLYIFPNIAEFARRHKAGTEAEFAATEKLVYAINKENNKFQAWIVSRTRQTAKRCEYLVLVHPGPDGERKLPQQNEPARMRVVFGNGSMTRLWDARRIESPVEFLDVKTPPSFELEKLAAFHVIVYTAEAHPDIKPLVERPTFAINKSRPEDKNDPPVACLPDSSSDRDFDSRSDSGIGDCFIPEPADRTSEVTLTYANAVHVNFLLTVSEATKNAELSALEQLCGRHINATERQIKAFEYFVLLRDAEFIVDLHEEIPHLKGAMREASWPGSPLAKKFALLNPQQKAAYMHGFDKLPCGICILPGGPGAGKTHFNLFTIAMAQSRPLPQPVTVSGSGQPQKRCAKVLFIVDMNSPVDDVANRMARLYDELGMKKSIIRMKGWSAEVRSSGRLNAAEDAASGGGMYVDFTNQFLRIANLMSLGHSSAGRSCKAPSLDEAAWQRYETHKTAKYEELTQFLERELWENNEVIPLRFRRLVYDLYRDTLANTDFIATTPVAASNHFRGMFKPDLVYFDESPHARELSDLIAIANFDPIAWIFCGDYRQTVPYVGSATSDCENIYREQMQVSMMERAAVANVIRHELLMNHRAFGGLHGLASSIWYGGRMVSGNENRTPASLAHVRKYLEGLSGGRPCSVPRLLVHIEDCGPEGRDGTSSWNPTHTAWVMARVGELLDDEKFRHVERNGPGTILIISPYKKAYIEYKNAIKRLPHWAQRRVETRTVDVVQGHEADFVFLDLVKAKSTKFLDDPNRLCVAVTRARLGEVIMMDPKMTESTTFLRNAKNLPRIYSLCKAAGQVVVVSAQRTPSSCVSGTEEGPVDVSPSALEAARHAAETEIGGASKTQDSGLALSNGSGRTDAPATAHGHSMKLGENGTAFPSMPAARECKAPPVGVALAMLGTMFAQKV